MNFTKRNRPIFIIGLITAIVFVVIIVIGQNTGSSISLTETLQNTFNVADRPIPELPAPTNEAVVPEVVAPPVPEGPTPPQIKRATAEMVFVDEGFIPKSLQTVQGQSVRWVNGTDREILIREIIKKHEEFAEGIVILPGEFYELELYGSKLWTFKELLSGKIGRIFITPNN